MDRLKSCSERKNIRFLLTARIPEFELFVVDRLSEVQEEKYRIAIRKFYHDIGLLYRVPLFTVEEIKEFIIKYKEISNPKSDVLVQEIAKKLFLKLMDILL